MARADRIGPDCTTSASWSTTRPRPDEKIKNHGGEFFMQLPKYPGVDAERKYKDINGIVFDVSEHDWRQAKES